MYLARCGQGSSLPPTAPRYLRSASPAEAHHVVVIHKVGNTVGISQKVLVRWWLSLKIRTYRNGSTGINGKGGGVSLGLGLLVCLASGHCFLVSAMWINLQGGETCWASSTCVFQSCIFGGPVHLRIWWLICGGLLEVTSNKSEYCGAHEGKSYHGYYEMSFGSYSCSTCGATI